MSDTFFPYLSKNLAIQTRFVTSSIGIMQPHPFLSSQLSRFRQHDFVKPHSRHVILSPPLTFAQSKGILPLFLIAAPTESSTPEVGSEVTTDLVQQTMEVLDPIIIPMVTSSTPPPRPLKVPNRAAASSSLPTRSHEDAPKIAMKRPLSVTNGSMLAKQTTMIPNTTAMTTTHTTTSTAKAAAETPSKEATTMAGKNSSSILGKTMKSRISQYTKHTGKGEENAKDDEEVEAPRPASIKLRRERQAKRAEQIKFWRVREEREARDARLVERRRLISGQPAAPQLAVQNNTKKVKFNLKRNRVFEISESTTL